MSCENLGNLGCRNSRYVPLGRGDGALSDAEVGARMSDRMMVSVDFARKVLARGVYEAMQQELRRRVGLERAQRELLRAQGDREGARAHGQRRDALEEMLMWVEVAAAGVEVE
jgi:hypothetical protein